MDVFLLMLSSLLLGVEPFSVLDSLNLADRDPDMKFGGFIYGFGHAGWGYMIPFSNLTTRYSKVVRFSLADFDTNPTIQTLDLADHSPDLSGFVSGLHHENWGYALGGSISAGESKVARFSLEDFRTIEALDLHDHIPGDSMFMTFSGGFKDDTWGYIFVRYRMIDDMDWVPALARFHLSDFRTVETLRAPGDQRRAPGFVWADTVVVFQHWMFEFSANTFESFGYPFEVFEGNDSCCDAALTTGNIGVACSTGGSKVQVMVGTTVPGSGGWFTPIHHFDLSDYDQQFQAVTPGFVDDNHVYFLPSCGEDSALNCDAKLSTIARMKAGFPFEVEVLKLNSADKEAKGFWSGFVYEGYGYLLPFFFAKIVRFDASETRPTPGPTPAPCPQHQWLDDGVCTDCGEGQEPTEDKTGCQETKDTFLGLEEAMWGVIFGIVGGVPTLIGMVVYLKAQCRHGVVGTPGEEAGVEMVS